MNSIVTRFAPSPTGNLHIGGVRTALINYIVTNQHKKKFPNSKFLLRIEDTDQKRSSDEYKKSILNGLDWLGISYDDEDTVESFTASMQIVEETTKTKTSVDNNIKLTSMRRNRDLQEQFKANKKYM